MDGKLFGNLHRMLKELKAACATEKIVPVSPHDLRRSAGRWMVDLSVPIELVSRFIRHADTKTGRRLENSLEIAWISARHSGFEPLAFGSGGRRSIQLS